VKARERGKRLALVILIAAASLNIWTGGPLFALWVGSRVQGDGPPTMGAFFVVTVVLLAVALALVRLVSILESRYEALTHQPSAVRKHAPWLRSMRGERKQYADERPQLTAPERVLVICAVVAVAVFEFWFFFLSGSPIDQRSGRGEVPTYVVSAGSASASATGPGPANRVIAASPARPTSAGPKPAM
jgi:hypothetical protein